MNKPKFETPNLTAENVAKIERLFPGTVTEGKVNFDLLRSMLGGDVFGDEAYEFTWVGKRAAIAEAGRPIRKTLRPCVEESKDWDTTENLYIEGDNLDVLKLLQESYLGKIKMCYIDPPYNTGNDFIYSDDFSQSREKYNEGVGAYDGNGDRLFRNTETNGRFHSDWCSMMYPRLVLARNMLSPDGVIFISIDDNEAAQLRELCDEVFGESNFIGILSVENNPKGRKNSAFISVSSEYCVIYAKQKGSAHFIENVPKKASDMTEDEDGNFVHGSGKRVLVGENSFNNYVAKTESDKNYSAYYRAKDRQLRIKKEGYGVFDQHLIADGYVKYSSHNNGKLVENTYTESKLRELFVQHALEFSADKIYEKNFNDTIRIKSQLINREYEAIVRGKKQKYSMELTTTGAGTYIKNLFEVNDSPFSAPKNIGYLKILLSLFENEPFIVLDFFSGSATTADAVMRLNAEDGGKRKFIMVQLPENLDENLQSANTTAEKQIIQSAISICENLGKPHLLSEIGKERIRRAGEKIKEEIGKERIYRAEEKIKGEMGLAAQNLDIGFRVLKVDDSNMNDVYYAAGDYTQDMISMMESNVKPDRTDMDLLYGCLLDWGLPLSMSHTREKIDGFTVHTYNGGDLIACFEERVSEKAIREIAGRKPLRTVFCDSSFTSSPEKINVFEIFKLLAPNTNVRVI